MNLLFGLTDIATKLGSSNATTDELIRLAAPKSFSAKDLAKMRQDCEILLDRSKKSAGDFQALVTAGLSGDLNKAGELATKLKLREEDFENEGGGVILVILVIAIVLLYSKKAH
jgi:hypothetical protein